MTTALLPPETIIENDTLTPEASDEALITAAKDLNESFNSHLRRSIEDFWRLGEKLVWLFDRPRPNARWADILKQIGISTTTDNHARHFYKLCPFAELSQYKNKTEALRAFGILSTPPKSSPGTTTKADSRHIVESAHDNYMVPSRASVPVRSVPPDVEDAPEADNTDVVEVKGDTVEGDDGSPTTDHPSPHGPDDSLKVLAMVAARLEILAETVIDVTPDHLAQIDRAMKALDRLRVEGVVDVR